MVVVAEGWLQECEKIFETASDIWQPCIDGGDLHGAILTGMSTYILLQAQNSEKLAQGALGSVHMAIKLSERAAVGEQGHELSCSFCGLREPGVKLAAGPNAFICSMCVDALGQVLSEK
jgi:hypothetical protein